MRADIEEALVAHLAEIAKALRELADASKAAAEGRTKPHP